MANTPKTAAGTDLDEETIRIAKRLLNTPPKPHKEMKIGKRKPSSKPKKKAP
jgi:hypothetical protein